MLVLLFCLSSAANIISLLQKTNPFKVTKYKKDWWIFRPKWAKIKIFAIIILSLCLFPLLIKVNVDQQLFGYPRFSKYLLLCSAQERN